MTEPTKKTVIHRFPGVSVWEFIVTTGYQHKFVMQEYDYGRATYYPPGSSCIVDSASNPAIVGRVCSGFMDLELYPELNTLGSGYTQTAQNDMRWYCLHYTDDTYDGISFFEFDGTSFIEPNKSFLFVDGTVNGIFRVDLLPATETGFAISGKGEGFLLTKRQ